MAKRTYDASLRRSSFWLAVIIPPTGYWTLVQWFAWQSGDGPGTFWAFLFLVMLANVLPIAALAWTLCSVAAYTVAPGKLIEHRVVHDREFALGPELELAELPGGEIAVRCERRMLRLRVTEPALCLASLREAEAWARARAA